MNAELHTNEKNMSNNSELDATVVAYGRKTYARLLKQCSNKDITKEAVKSVLLEMYTTMEASGCADPLEAMMYIQGQKFQNEYLKETVGEELDMILKDIVPEDEIAETAALKTSSARECVFVPEQTSASHVEESQPLKSSDPQRRSEPMYSVPQPAVEPSQSTPAIQDSDIYNPGKEETSDITREPMPARSNLSAAPDVYPDMQGVRNEKKGGFWSGLLIVILIICILAMLWVIVGIIMGTGLAPRLDLGYEWFNENITWFF